MTIPKTPACSGESPHSQRQSGSTRAQAHRDRNTPLAPMDPTAVWHATPLKPQPFQSAVGGSRLPPAGRVTDLEMVMQEVQDRVSKLVDDSNPDFRGRNKFQRPMRTPPPILSGRRPTSDSSAPLSADPISSIPFAGFPPPPRVPRSAHPTTDTPLVIHVTSPSSLRGVSYRVATAMTLLAFAGGAALAWSIPREAARTSNEGRFRATVDAAAAPRFMPYDSFPAASVANPLVESPRAHASGAGPR